MNWNTFKRTVYFVWCCSSIRAYVNVDSIHFNWIASRIELNWIIKEWKCCKWMSETAWKSKVYATTAYRIKQLWTSAGVICMHNFWNNALRFGTMALCCSFHFHRGLLQFTPVLRVNNLMSLFFSPFLFFAPISLVVSFPFSTWICHARLLTCYASRWENHEELVSRQKYK